MTTSTNLNTKKLTDNNDEENFSDLFRKNLIYEIPLFQRDYKWDFKLIKAVIRDFEDIYEGQKDVHFFGAIIVYEIKGRLTDSKKIEVIDGQQRLTTVFLFILAAVFVVRGTGDLESAKELYDLYLVSKNQPNLKPNINDRAQLNWIFKNILTKPFLEILEGSQKFEQLEFDSNSKEDGALRSNYTRFKYFFESKIEEIEDRNQKVEIIFNCLERILNACRVVSIKIDQRHHGPLIFDKLNANPVRMTISELIKNAIFARMADQEIEKIVQVHKSYWVPFEKRFVDGNKGLENYFFPFGLIHDPSTTKTDAYRSITDSWLKDDTLDTKKIIENLSEYQMGYNALTTGKTSGYSKDIQEHIYRIHGAKLPNTALPFLMCVLKRVEINESYTSEAIRIFNCLETFFVRRQVCGIEPTGLHAVFKNLWPTLSASGEVTSEKVLRCIKNLNTQKCPDDQEFEDSLKNAQIGKKVIRRFLVEQYDRSLGGEYQEWNKYTEVEHVLPRNITDWAEFPSYDEDTHEAHVNLFGNLVPLTGEFNNNVSNKPYSEKKSKITSNTMYKSTRILFESNDDWTPSDIQKRTNELAQWALTRWKY